MCSTCSFSIKESVKQILAPILVATKQASADSPFGLLSGHESSILPLIAAFAGATGLSLTTCVEVIDALEEVAN